MGVRFSHPLRKCSASQVICLVCRVFVCGFSSQCRFVTPVTVCNRTILKGETLKTEFEFTVYSAYMLLIVDYFGNNLFSFIFRITIVIIDIPRRCDIGIPHLRHRLCVIKLEMDEDTRKSVDLLTEKTNALLHQTMLIRIRMRSTSEKHTLS